MRTPRALLLLLGSVAVVIAAVQGIAGMTELAFYAGPFLLVIGLLLSGRFIGEQAILARPPPPAARRPRPQRRRWLPAHERPLASVLERRVPALRGPPAQPCAA